MAGSVKNCLPNLDRVPAYIRLVIATPAERPAASINGFESKQGCTPSIVSTPQCVAVIPAHPLAEIARHVDNPENSSRSSITDQVNARAIPVVVEVSPLKGV